MMIFRLSSQISTGLRKSKISQASILGWCAQIVPNNNDNRNSMVYHEK